MIRKKRILSAFLAASLVFTLASCGKSVEQQDSKSVSVGETAVSTEDYFPLEKAVDVTIAGVRNDEFTPMSKMQFIQNLEEETNVNVKWIDWPQLSLKEKKNLAFASGDLPDAILGGYCLDPDEVVQYGEQGFLLAFDEYIDNGMMPNFAAALEKDPAIRSAITTPSGKIYALPTINLATPLYDTNATTMINKTWLDKLGLEVPKTTQELYDVLVAFKEAGDLNGNGQNDEIPMSFKYGDNNTGFFSMLGWFGHCAGTYGKSIVVDGKVENYAMLPDYKDAMTFFNKLYTEKLLDQEIFTMDTAAYNAKTIAEIPSVGVISNWSTAYLNNPITNGDAYIYLPPLQPENGNRPMWQKRIYSYNGNFSFAINANSKYIEELVRWVDLWYDVDTSIDALYGGSEYLISHGDGVYEMVTKDAAGNNVTWAQKSAYSPVNFSVGCILPNDFTWKEIDANTQKKLDANDVYKPYLEQEYYNSSWFVTADEKSALAAYTLDVTNYRDEMAASFITEGNIENRWDEYVQQMSNVGADKIKELQQNIYDRNQKS